MPPGPSFVLKGSTSDDWAYRLKFWLAGPSKEIAWAWELINPASPRAIPKDIPLRIIGEPIRRENLRNACKNRSELP